MFGDLGKMAGIFKQVREMQGRMQQVQETLAAARFEAAAGGGTVTATVNGRMELVGVKISPELAGSGDVEMLEDLVRSAVCAAQRKAADGVKAEMQKMTGGMLPPGLEGLLGKEG